MIYLAIPFAIMFCIYILGAIFEDANPEDETD